MIRVVASGASADSRPCRRRGDARRQRPATQRSVLDALEMCYPMLRGTIRDHVTLQRRPFLRFFRLRRGSLSRSAGRPLPDAVATGAEPFLVVGAMAGG